VGGPLIDEHRERGQGGEGYVFILHTIFLHLPDNEPLSTSSRFWHPRFRAT
jgi:hypothetical protein